MSTSERITLYEEYRLIERSENKVIRIWKGAHILLFSLAAVFGTICTFGFHMLMYLFNGKCVLFPKIISMKEKQQAMIINDISPDEKPDLTIDFVSAHWVDKSTCLLPTYVPLMSSISGLIWLSMFMLMSSDSKASGGGWRALPTIFCFSLAMGSLCLYTSFTTSAGLQDLSMKLREATNTPPSCERCSIAINVVTLAFEKRIRGVYQAIRLTIVTSWLHALCWMFGALLIAIRILLVVDFQVVKVRVVLRGNLEKILESQEHHLRTVYPDKDNEDGNGKGFNAISSDDNPKRQYRISNANQKSKINRIKSTMKSELKNEIKWSTTRTDDVYKEGKKEENETQRELKDVEKTVSTTYITINLHDLNEKENTVKTENVGASNIVITMDDPKFKENTDKTEKASSSNIVITMDDRTQKKNTDTTEKASTSNIVITLDDLKYKENTDKTEKASASNIVITMDDRTQKQNTDTNEKASASNIVITLDDSKYKENTNKIEEVDTSYIVIALDDHKEKQITDTTEKVSANNIVITMDDQTEKEFTYATKNVSASNIVITKDGRTEKEYTDTIKKVSASKIVITMDGPEKKENTDKIERGSASNIAKIIDNRLERNTDTSEKASASYIVITMDDPKKKENTDKTEKVTASNAVINLEDQKEKKAIEYSVKAIDTGELTMDDPKVKKDTD